MSPHPVPISVVTAQVTVPVPGEAVQLPDNPCRSVSIAALPGNAGNVYVGDSGVTSANGRTLAARDGVDMAIDNTNKLWVDAAQADEGISFLAVV